MNRNKKFLLALASFVLVAALLVSLFGGAPQVNAAPGAAPTPQTYNAARTDANVVTWASAKSITADTRWCVDTRNYNAADIQWTTDQGTTNTTTLKLQFSNDNIHFTDGATLVSANAADASDLNRQLLYGRWACVFADVANANAIVITVIGVAK